MVLRKITVIGTGRVGSTIAFTLAVKNVANEIVLVDINREKAAGEAMDIHQGTPLLETAVNVRAGDYTDASGSDIVIITSGVPRKPGQSRLDLTQINVDIIRQIAPQITCVCPDAAYVIVSNPVDIQTYVFQKLTGIPADRVFGSGTLLDTARLRARIAEYLSVSQKNVHAYVLGEHGDTSFIPWSIAEISTISLADCQDQIRLKKGVMQALDHDEIDRYMRSSGARIIASKGWTNYAIAISTCAICQCLTGGVNTVATLSTMLNGQYGIDDVCLSLPVLIGNGRLQGHILPKLTQEEAGKLRFSAETLKNVLAQIRL